MSGLWQFFLERSRVVWLLTLGILILGVTSFGSIARETTPTIEIPAASVSTLWPGASTGDVEELVTNVIERKIDGLENLEGYDSVSRAGISIISVEFESGTDKSENMNRLREKIDEAERELPDGVPNSPQVSEVSISDVPILTLSLSGDYAWSELKRFAEKLEDVIEENSQVKRVTLAGQPMDAWHIYIDPIKLEAAGLSVNAVINALRGGSAEFPLGEVKVDGQTINSSLKGKLEDVDGLMNLPISEENGAIIMIKDVGEVRKEFAEFGVETFFLTKEKAQSAVSIEVVKSAAKGNAIAMVEDILAKIENLQANGELPKDLNINTTYSRADEIQESLGTLTNSGGQTLILIFIVMLIALGWKESLLASICIPLSMFVAIAGLQMMGESFNGISLFALVLAVGLLVDNAIIVVEGLYDEIKHGKSPIEAAKSTIMTFRWPILTGTLTTIFAFLPMLFFITGVSGDYIRIIPITIMLVLGGAFFVSLFLLPNIGAQFYAWFPPKKKEQESRTEKVQKWYEKRMKKLLNNWWKSVLVVLASFLVLGFSITLLTSNKVPVEVFPGSDFPYFVGEVTLPEGTELSETKSLIEPISEAIKPLFAEQNGEIWLESVVFTAGRPSGLVAEPGQIVSDSSNVLGIAFNLTDKEDRTTKSYDMVETFEEKIKQTLPSYAEYQTREQTGGPPSGSPIEIRVQGPDISRLDAMVTEINKKLEGVEDLLNLRDSRSEKVTQLNWQFDREKLATYGLSPASVAETLRSAINGVTVMQITESGEEIDVNLRLDWLGERKWKAPDSLAILGQIPLQSVGGEIIQLAQVANATPESPLSQVNHKDGVGVLFIRADLPKTVTASEKAAEINEIIKEITLNPNESVTLGGEAEEGNRLINEMGMAMGFAVVLILLVLVIQFNSFHQSVMVLVLIPLSLTGVFIGFWLTGRTVSFPTMIGIVSLAGIIVNDAIVLVDQLNQKLKEKGVKYEDALIYAGSTRLQPIFLTSVTTVLGMLPLSLSDEVWGGLGFAIIYGMLLSTILCLLLLPCLLRLWRSVGNGRRALWRKIRGKREHVLLLD